MSGPGTMKAVAQDAYGPADVLQLKDIAKPAPGDDDVLIRTHAAGVDQGVWHLMTGVPYLVRVMGFGLRAPKVPVRGRDVAGTVEAVGANVTRFQPGDEVFGVCEGSFAEYGCAEADKLAHKPANVTFEQAAAVPVSGCTALQALRDKGEVGAGQRVLVIGAGGGVGTFAVQLARAFGAEVTGVCSTAKTDLVQSLGAVRVIDYTREDFAADGQHYDIIVDTGGQRALSHLRRALAARGRLVIVGAEVDGRVLGGIERQARARLLSPFLSQKLGSLFSQERGEDLRFLAEQMEVGRVTPVVDRTYPLSEVPEAIRQMREGRARGKVVIAVMPTPP